MKNGHLFLADEISLTDDSVLERLNSLLGDYIRNCRFYLKLNLYSF
jgi:midasin (ATPase involved in ribosome maturation)